VVTVIGTLVGRIHLTDRQRSLRWILQALLVAGGLAHPGFGFVLAGVVPLVLGLPVGPLATGRGRLVGFAAQGLGVASFTIDPSHLAVGVAALLAMALQSGLVFLAAFVLSGHAVPLLRRAEHSTGRSR
jgi:hypothetical protein